MSVRLNAQSPKFANKGRNGEHALSCNVRWTEVILVEDTILHLPRIEPPTMQSALSPLVERNVYSYQMYSSQLLKLLLMFWE